jgi:hypothetical protein
MTQREIRELSRLTGHGMLRPMHERGGRTDLLADAVVACAIEPLSQPKDIT